MSDTNDVGLVAWGLKDGYQIFFSSDNIDVKTSAIQRTLEDARTLVKYTNVGLYFYSLEWTDKYKVLTKYLTIYDWGNRKNAYLAISLYIPFDKRFENPLQVLDKLVALYEAKYVTNDFKIRRTKEDPTDFFGLIKKTALIDDFGRERPNLPQSTTYGLINYEEGEMEGFFKNTYLDVYKDYKEIFFLKAKQSNLRPSSVMVSIAEVEQREIKPEKLVKNVNIRIRPVINGLPGEVDYEELQVEIGGVEAKRDENGLYSKNFPDSRLEGVKVKISYDGGYEFEKSWFVSEWHGKVYDATLAKKTQKLNTKRDNILAQSKRGQSRNENERKNKSDYTISKEIILSDSGPYSLKVVLKQKTEKEQDEAFAIKINEKPVKITFKGMKEVFYIDNSVIQIRGIAAGGTLEGEIEAEKYGIGFLKYSAPDSTEAVTDIPSESVYFEPEKIDESPPKKEKEEGNDQGAVGGSVMSRFGKPVIIVLAVLLVCGGAYFFWETSTAGSVGVTEEERVALKKEFVGEYNNYNDSLKSIIDDEKQFLKIYEKEIESAKKKEIDTAVIQNASRLVIEVRNFLNKGELLGSAKKTALLKIDTTSGILPSIASLEELLKKPISSLTEDVAKFRSAIETQKNDISDAIDVKSNEEDEDNRKIRVRKQNAGKATAIADDASELKSSKTYGRYVRWSASWNTEKTDFSGNERSRVNKKLQLLKRIAELEHNARNDINGDKATWLVQLESKMNSDLLSPEQKQMIKKYYDAIPF